MFAVGHYFYKKETLYNEIFGNVEKCQKYHLDYVEDFDHLPVGKKMILFGKANSENPEEEILVKTYIKKTNEENRFWNFKLKNSFNLINQDMKRV